MSDPQYIYAIGEIEPQFPTLDVEREFWQAAGNPSLVEPYSDEPSQPSITHTVQEGDTLYSIAQRYNLHIGQILEVNTDTIKDPNNLSEGITILIPLGERERIWTDRELIHKILVEKPYLAREVHWVFSVNGVETYWLLPRTEEELNYLIASTERQRPELPMPKPPNPGMGGGGHGYPPPPPIVAPIRKDVIIGVRDAKALYRAEYPSQLPSVTCDRIYSFLIAELVRELHAAQTPNLNPADDTPQLRAFLTQAYEDIFLHIASIEDNVGSHDEHRVLNYLVMRDTSFYLVISQQYRQDASLVNIAVKPSKLGSYRDVYDVVLTFRGRKTERETKLFARVDVTGEWPFLVTPFQRYFGN